MRVAAVQLGAYKGDYTKQMAMIEKLVRQAGQTGADIICLPELMATPYFARSHDPKWREWAEPLLIGPTYKRIRALAIELQCAIIGTCYEQANSTLFNSAFIVGADGELIGQYRKTHIPMIEAALAFETIFFDQGEELPVFEVMGSKVGILICYDRSFPEAWRTLALKGAQVIFVPTSSSGFRGGMYVSELQVAAAQQQVFVVAANKCGEEYLPGEVGSIIFYGKSTIISPDGSILGELDKEQGTVLTADFNISEVADARQKLAYYRDRRTDLYSL